jgi:hypothetical protein
MPKRKPPPSDEKPQFERFLETVREVGAAETDEGLGEAVRKVMRSTSSHTLGQDRIDKPDKASSRRSAKAPVSKK